MAVWVWVLVLVWVLCSDGYVGCCVLIAIAWFMLALGFSCCVLLTSFLLWVGTCLTALFRFGLMLWCCGFVGFLCGVWAHIKFTLGILVLCLLVGLFRGVFVGCFCLQLIGLA